MTTPSAEPRASARRHLLLAVKIAVSIALLWFLFSRIDAGRLKIPDLPGVGFEAKANLFAVLETT